ncbi:MAG: DUF1569 domain-containing protein [Flavobacteriia bacterium]|jgi:hydroxymethylglutaryl-CoA reductase
MEFIEPNLETVLPILDKLTLDSKPLWGSMSAQRMVEHLTDSVRIATGENPQALLIEEEKLPRMLAFLDSDKPMAQGIEVPFASPAMELRNEELELAVDELVDTLLEFDELYETNPGLTHVHPFYGPLNYEQWTRLNAKHLTHHFNQFGLI